MFLSCGGTEGVDMERVRVNISRPLEICVFFRGEEPIISSTRPINSIAEFRGIRHDVIY